MYRDTELNFVGEVQEVRIRPKEVVIRLKTSRVPNPALLGRMVGVPMEIRLANALLGLVIETGDLRSLR